MAKLYEYFGLPEGLRQGVPEKTISQKEIERKFGYDALVNFDRDVPGSAATFYIVHDGILFANTKGNGWWVYDPRDSSEAGKDPHWHQTQKPTASRSADHRANMAKKLLYVAQGPEVRADRNLQKSVDRQFGGHKGIVARVKTMEDEELLDRIEQEEMWAQTIWPESEPLLTNYVEREIRLRGLNANGG